jgi:nucleoside-diphosphate-sugar epimerase
MRLIISGATGFIGSRLVSKLVEAGHEIGILVRDSSDLTAIGMLDSVAILKSDTYADIYESFASFKPLGVLHLATLYRKIHNKDDIPNLVNSNIVYGTNLLEVMKEFGVRRIINFGTRWQHLNNLVDCPANLYAATKNAFQNILMYYHYSHGIEYTTLELSDTYGKNDPREKIVELMVNACKQKKALQLSPGEQIIDLICVDDLIRYIIVGLANNEFFHNEVLAISGTVIKLKDLGEEIENIFGVSGFLKWGERPYRESEIMIPPIFHPIKKIETQPLKTQLIKQYLQDGE